MVSACPSMGAVYMVIMVVDRVYGIKEVLRRFLELENWVIQAP